MKIVRCRHAHPGRCKPSQRVALGMLPRRLLLLPAITRALGHRARLATVLDLAPLGVVHRLVETALVGFLVHLGATNLLTTLHDIDHGFLATHELAVDMVNQAVNDQGFDSARGLHVSDVLK